MKKTIAVLLQALLSLAAAADVVAPSETTGGGATESVTRSWPLVFLLVAGVALIIVLAVRRRKSATPEP